MIHIGFDLQRLTEQQKAEWEQLTADVDKAVQENIEAWERWKQLQKYDELVRKEPKTLGEHMELGELQTTLQAYLRPDGQIAPAHRLAQPQFNFKARQQLWAGIKIFLLENVFNGKCAYCETQTGQFPYDAEHYRPKGEVTFKDDDDVSQYAMTEDESGREIQHPGYFWLSFEWKNLVPSCRSCNGPGGKMTQFPVQQHHYFLRRLTPEEAAKMVPSPYPSPTWPGLYYLRSEQLDQLEEPLLLHPYLDNENNPRRHIRFGYKGIEYAVNESLKGKQSIKVFRLYKETLRSSRYEIQKKAAALLTGAFRHYIEIENLSPQESLKKARQTVCDYEEGRVAYCAAALDYLDETTKAFALLSPHNEH
jgi:hypothetical protein